MNVNYYLKDSKKENSAVVAIVRFKGDRFKLAPGVSVKTEFWDPENKRLFYKRGRKPYADAGRANIVLDRFEGDIKRIFEPHILNRTRPTIAEIKTALCDEVEPAPPPTKYFTDYFKQYYENADYKNETWKKYNTTYNWLLKYEKRTGERLTFEAVNIDFYEHFRFWILNKKYRPSKTHTPRNYSINYFGSLIKCIKKVMRETGPESRLKLHTNREATSRYFKTENETADNIYLNTSELLKIHLFTATAANISEITADKRLENRQRKADALNLAKNKFLIGAFTALRVSDFNRLDNLNLATGFISIHPAKGSTKNDPVIIPIHPVIREILAEGFNLSTPISEQKLNKHIKEVARLVGINEPVTTARTEGGKVVERTAAKWEKVSTHTARRSGATNMFLAGIPSISIMKITGHRTETSFLKYIKVSQAENARLLANHAFFK